MFALECNAQYLQRLARMDACINFYTNVYEVFQVVTAFYAYDFGKLIFTVLQARHACWFNVASVYAADFCNSLIV